MTFNKGTCDLVKYINIEWKRKFQLKRSQFLEML